MEKDKIHLQFDEVVKHSLEKYGYRFEDVMPKYKKERVHEEFDAIVKKNLNESGDFLEENVTQDIAKPLIQRTDEYVLLDLEYLNEE